jgi:hypothetical protein
MHSSYAITYNPKIPMVEKVEMTCEESLMREIFYRGLVPRKQFSYDGVNGTLPGWFHSGYQLKFEHSVRPLLAVGEDGARTSPEQIIEWMDAYCRLRNGSKFKISKDYFPIKHIGNIEVLVHFRDIALLGKEDGLRLFHILDNLSRALFIYRMGGCDLNILNTYRPTELLDKYEEAGTPDFDSSFWKELCLLAKYGDKY